MQLASLATHVVYNGSRRSKMHALIKKSFFSSRASKDVMDREIWNCKRVCSSCKEEKPLDKFLKNKTCFLGRTRKCTDCTNLYKIKWYNDNRERRREAANKRNQQRRDEAIATLGGKCSRCNGVFPRCVYDFHHINSDDKVDSISNLLKRPAKLKEELKKCILLCANCHRIRHFEEGKE